MTKDFSAELSLSEKVFDAHVAVIEKLPKRPLSMLKNKNLNATEGAELFQKFAFSVHGVTRTLYLTEMQRLGHGFENDSLPSQT